MKKTAFLLVVAALFLANSSHLHAQISNGSFTDGFTGWTVIKGSSGGPQVLTSTAPLSISYNNNNYTGLDVGQVTPPTPPTGTTQALIQGPTSDTTGAYSASAATIETALGTTLASTQGPDDLGADPGTFIPLNGQAIYQTFTTTNATTLSFDYSFQTFDFYPFDEAGYVLNGVYHDLAQPSEDYNSWYNDGPSLTPTLYKNVSLSLNTPGTYTLGFVAYETGTNANSSAYSNATSLFVTDVSVPEPSEWALMLLGGASLILAGRLRSKLLS